MWFDNVTDRTEDARIAAHRVSGLRDGQTVSRPNASDPSFPVSTEQYPVPCPECGADAHFTGVSTVVGHADLLHLTVECGGCRYTWTIAKSTLPLGIR